MIKPKEPTLGDVRGALWLLAKDVSVDSKVRLGALRELLHSLEDAGGVTATNGSPTIRPL